jgi:hypothetical protein
MRRLGLLLLFLALGSSAAPAKRPATVAPDTVPHPVALFLGTLSKAGARQVTFRAMATGTHFFYEEPAGVTVYRYVDGNYVKQEFLRGTTLAKAAKKYTPK